MSLNLYYDLMTQPSRALYILLQVCKIPHKRYPTSILKGEQLTDSYKKINRIQKVPAINYYGFKLSESIAILRFLSNENKIPDLWYPKSKEGQARVDEYLEWQHNNVRASCAMYFRKKWLEPLTTGQKPPQEKLRQFETRMSNCLDNMEKLWLTPGPYVTGRTISAADIWAACEIEQPRMAGYDPTIGRPVLEDWLNRVRNDLDPYYSEAHFLVDKIALEANERISNNNN